jgi:single-stranded-DNA-specific exonuclease
VLADQIAEISPGILFVKDERLSLRALGHVAGKLKDRHQLPALILGKKNIDWIGECRGINGVDLIALLKAHREYFSAFGGHKKACGFTVSNDKVEEFIKSARKYAKENFAGHIIKENRIIPDAELQVKDLTEDIFNLQPFGEGNPAPVLISTNTPISKSNGKIVFLERTDLDVKNGTDQQFDSDRVYADILYTVDDNHSIVILKVDYPQ